MKRKDPIQRYEIDQLVAEDETYRLYICCQKKTGRECLLQVAVDAGKYNGAFDRMGFVLTELKRESARLEEEFARKQEGQETKMTLNYQFGFPELVESFVSQEQGGRRINILAFHGEKIKSVSQMVPLASLIEKDGLRVDIRTSAWIMGKLLKDLVLPHFMGIAVQRLDTANVLICPEEHYVVIFDWSRAQSYEGVLPITVARSEIAQAAQTVIVALGGDRETRFIPDGGKETQRYTDYLFSLAAGGQHDAGEAHRLFYEIVDETWEHGFYDFTSHPRNQE